MTGPSVRMLTVSKRLPPVFVILLMTNIAMASNAFHADVSLIREFNQSLHDKHSFQPFPKLIRFISGNKSLVYVATRHKDLEKSKELIRRAIDQTSPEIILLEGMRASWGQSPRKWDGQTSDKDGYEVNLAYKLAIEKGIPFLGAEPGKPKEFSSFQRDQSAIKKIAELMSQYNKVLVVYGAGHYVQEEEALKKMFGAPELLQ